LFLSKHGNKDSGVWFETLKELTPKALESGMARLTNLSAGQKFCEFPPNCLQFKSLCLAFYDDLRLPKVHDAYREIKSRAYGIDSRWSHAVVKYTAMRLPQDFYAIEQEHIAYDLFKAAFKQVCSLVKQGHPIPEVTATPRLPKVADKNIAQYYLKQMRQQLGVS